jgi:glycosyltransferase involved in cell wall biosynthesis
VAATVIDGVELRRYPSPTAPSPSARNVREHSRMSSDIARSVATDAPIDAVLGHSPLQYLSAARALKGTARRCYGVHSPLVAELRDGVVGPPSWKQRVAWRLAWHIERRVLKISDLVHCDSDYTRGVMAAEHPGAFSAKTVVLPGWVDAERFRPPSVSKDALRACLGAPWQAAVPTFFSLRRLVPRMGLDTLVEAAAILARDGRTFRVVIGGDGPGRASLEALASARGVADRVVFVGQIPEIRLANSYAAADCFVLPTRALECFGLIVLEAYACGIPVVGVPVGAIPEVMGEAFAGWIADDNRAPALARRMDDVLQGRLAAQPEALRRRAREFDMGVVMGQHERVLLGQGAAQ